MRRAFLLGVSIGGLVLIQAVLIFRLPIRLPALQAWALAWSGVFGLVLGYSSYVGTSQPPPPLALRIHCSIFANTSGAVQSLVVTAVCLVCFYGVSAMLIRASYRRFRWAGVACTFVLILLIHISLYLIVIKSTVA